MQDAGVMNRRAFLVLASSAAVFLASPAHADFVDAVRAQLQKQGYSQISVSSTLLGRSRILAKSKSGTREIILNPRTGEILRDLWFSAQGGTGPSIVGSDEDDDEDDDDRDDDGGDDNGGRGRGRGEGDKGSGGKGSGGDGD